MVPRPQPGDPESRSQAKLQEEQREDEQQERMMASLCESLVTLPVDLLPTIKVCTAGMHMHHTITVWISSYVHQLLIKLDQPNMRVRELIDALEVDDPRCTSIIANYAYQRIRDISF